MVRPQEASTALRTTLQAFAKSGTPEAADTIRQHLASPALAHFSVGIGMQIAFANTTPLAGLTAAVLNIVQRSEAPFTGLNELGSDSHSTL